MPESPAPRRSTNDRRLAERIGRHRALILAVQNDPDAAALAASRGYSADRMQQGLALADAALVAYETRDRDAGAHSASGQTLREQEAAAQRRVQDLRSILRAVYDDAPTRTALGVAAPRSATDRDAFFTETRATLHAARRAPYAAALADAGVTSDDLAALAETLDALETAAQARVSASGVQTTSTASRDEASDALQAWITRFRRLLRPTFRDAPAVAARIGF